MILFAFANCNAPAYSWFQVGHGGRAPAPRWFAPMDFRDRERENRDTETLGIGLAVKFEIGGPGGACTLNPPADNGLLC